MRTSCREERTEAILFSISECAIGTFLAGLHIVIELLSGMREAKIIQESHLT